MKFPGPTHVVAFAPAHPDAHGASLGRRLILVLRSQPCGSRSMPRQRRGPPGRRHWRGRWRSPPPRGLGESGADSGRLRGGLHSPEASGLARRPRSPTVASGYRTQVGSLARRLRPRPCRHPHTDVGSWMTFTLVAGEIGGPKAPSRSCLCGAEFQRLLYAEPAARRSERAVFRDGVVVGGVAADQLTSQRDPSAAVAGQLHPQLSDVPSPRRRASAESAARPRVASRCGRFSSLRGL